MTPAHQSIRRRTEMNLYDLTSNWQQVYEMDIDEETWRDTLDAIDESITDKANSIGFIIQNLNADIENYKREEKRLASKRRSAENKVKGLKAYLQDNMERLDRKQLKTDLFNFNIQNNPAGTNITDEQLIPSKYYETETVKKYDKRAMLDDLKAGQVIAGVELKQAQSLRIR